MKLTFLLQRLTVNIHQLKVIKMVLIMMVMVMVITMAMILTCHFHKNLCAMFILQHLLYV